MMVRKDEVETAPDAIMRRMVNGFMLTQALAIAAELSLADYVATSPLSVADLAEATGANEDALFRLLRYLSSCLVFAVDDDRVVANTRLSETLISDRSDTVRNWAILAGKSYRWSVTGNLRHTIQTGEPAFAATLGSSQWEYFATHPDDGALFNATMEELSTTMVQALIAAYDFSSTRVIVDVGGGTGSTIVGILDSNPSTRGILFDVPEVVERGRSVLAARGLQDRVRCVAGDFFKRIPEGGDLYILRAILHDWDDEQAAVILRNCQAVMRPGTRLLVNEGLFPDDDSPSLFRFGDLLMMVMLGGRERTREEFHALLNACGFELQGVVPTQSPLHIIEAIRR